MGFLSRKKKAESATVAEETHPLEEELQGMEAAVPERPVVAENRDDVDEVPPTAGPVPDEAPSSSQAAGEDTSSAPPADEAPATDAQPPAVEKSELKPQPQAVEPQSDDDEPGEARMKAVDLIAPTRLDFLKPAEPEAEQPIKTADVIVFANQKGGVAKTTTTLNLAVAFAESGYRVLCVDLDPQGNLTMSQGIDPDKVEHSLYDVLVNDMPISEIIVRREIDIAVSSIDLAGAEIAMSTKIGRERSLEKALKEVAADYDFVCIDTPPSLGLLTINALTAANKVIVPVQCEYLSMRGLVQLQNTLRMIQENLNPDVHIEGILPTMLDTRTIHAKEAVEILEENFGDLVFQSRIRKAIKFAEAPVKGASVLKYDSDSSAANYYRELAKEVLANGSA
ncbi:MAG TPA: AAA family ATPase [Solirubrobacterales bacterium]|nr:AAA family ATPase [Solirubrobacterales bacterium]